MSLFSAFSPLNGGALNTYQYPTESPYDLDAGLDYTRGTNTMSSFPFPVVLGYVDGFVPTGNQMEFNLMLGKNTFGPYVGQTSAPMNMVFPNIMGSLSKVQG